MRTTLTMACLAVAATALGGAATKANAQIYTGPQRVDTTVALDPHGTLRVTVYAGRVNVVGSSASNVHIKGTVEVGELEVRSRYGTVSLNMDENPSRARANLDITVPIGTNVILEGFSAPFTVRGVKGEAKIETLSGTVQVSDGAGTVQVETVSGDIAVSNVDGSVRAEAVSADVTVAGVSGDIDTESVSGRISLTGAKSRSVRAETVSGSIGYGGTIEATGNYVFKTNSGRLTLGMPAGAGATVSLQTFSGNVDSDFPVTLESGTSRHGHESKFEFRIGDGRSRIVLETFSGDIRIQRGTSRDNQE